MNVKIDKNKVIVGNKLDYFFFIFPIWVPLSIILVNAFSNIDDRLIAFVFLAIIGESHFAATLFFFTKKNRDYIIANKNWFIFIPICLIIINTSLFLWNITLTLIIASLMSAFHVTRQSIGINRLFSKRKKNLELTIYISSLWFVFFGGLKLLEKLKIVEYLPNFLQKNYTGILDSFRLLSYFFIFILICLIFAKYQKDRNLGELNIKQTLVLSVGIFMYSPYLFFDPVMASVLGVSIHWVQYLFLTATIYFRNTMISKLNHNFSRLMTMIFFIFVTSAISIGDFNRTVNDLITLALIIPLNLQLLHYYYDGLIWKASDPYLNENIFRKIFQ